MGDGSCYEGKSLSCDEGPVQEGEGVSVARKCATSIRWRILRLDTFPRLVMLRSDDQGPWKGGSLCYLERDVRRSARSSLKLESGRTMS